MRGNKLYRALDRHAGRALILALAAAGAGRRRAEPPRSIRRILVVKLSALGDTVLLTPALQELRARYPGVEIGMVGTQVNRAIAAELTPLIDRFHCLEVGRAVREPGYLAGFVRTLRGEGWEVGIDFDAWTNITPLLLSRAGIPVRLGFRTGSRVRHLLYTHTVARDPGAHESRNFQRLLAPLGIEPGERALFLPVRAELVAGRRRALRERGWNGTDRLLFVHPGCGHAHPRAWPLERYRELCGRILDRPGTFAVFTGAGEERALAESLAGSFPRASTALTDTSLAELIAALSLADLVVTGNTGVMHLAAALRLPQVVLEGPNDPAKWGPLNPNAAIIRSSCPGCPCLDMGWEFHRTDGYCMEQIGVEEVYRVVRERLRSAGAAAAGAG